ncbi:RHS repeat-associated core domain-containing protein [Xenorhabdus bovienii]|uniref:RHS repeat-associated core domain-containing protein n=1 Tax=Xenorhabdus bovienii TaxID=40576 RepID=UPI0023B27288|nr:RHS repeat-associated core domain-containing protein [Xenorhabdus bovienii]MDE9553219.1 hypothetical protein [Xenorhabdus bovienii]
MELSHISQAFNFISAISGHVDPRIGIFCVNIPIIHLIGNGHMGPELPLTLFYSPLNGNDTVYGLGFSDNITRYNKKSKILTLSTGQSYHVQEEGIECKFSHAKPMNFKFSKKENDLWVIYKTGVSEKLTEYNSMEDVKVTREIYSPSGNKLFLDWEKFGGNLRLKSVKDQLVTLLSITYSSTSENIVFDIWPDSEEHYAVTLIKRGLFLSTIKNNALPENLEWHLSYSGYGSSNNHQYLTEMVTPAGLITRVEYQINGHRLPENSNTYQTGPVSPVRTIDQINYLPYVKKYITESGPGIPKQIITYEYSTKNFLGYGGRNVRVTSYGQDYLYNVENNYLYHSIEKKNNADENVLYSTTRVYDNYHLIVEEKEQTTLENHDVICEKSTQIKYYADVTKSFDDQVTQYQMPQENLIKWKKGNDFRIEKIITEYDDYCNILSMTEIDGTITTFTYYDVNGEVGKCPAEPHGFKKFIKEQTIFPPKSDFQTPIRKIQYKYKSYPVRNSNSFITNGMVLLKSEIYFSDNLPIRSEEIEYYNNVGTLNHGRVSERRFKIVENGSESSEFKEEYQWSNITNNKNIECITRFTGSKDNLSVSKAQQWTPRAYRLIFEKDIQNNVTEFKYDKIGRIISRTLNPGTQYENKIMHSWFYSELGVPLSFVHTDALGNSYRINMDGMGRLLEKYYFTKEIPDGFRIEKREYNGIGQLDKIIYSDLLNPGEKSEDIRNNIISLKYDHWGQNISLNYSDGTSVQDIFDPIYNRSRYQIVSSKDNNKKATGIIQKEFDVNSQLIKIILLKADGKTEEGSWKLIRDGLGRLRKSIDESNNTTIIEYDVFNNVSNQTLPDDTKVKKIYQNFLPVQLSVTPKGGEEKILGTQEFDSLGRLTSTSSGGRKIILRYQEASPVPDQVTDAEGNSVQYKYIPELKNAVTEINFGSIFQKLEYDCVTGHLLKATENNGVSLAFTYTNSGQLKEENFTLPNNVHRISRYNFSIANRIITYTGVDNVVQFYKYDENCRLSQIHDAGITVDLKYDELGRHIGQLIDYNINNKTMNISLDLDNFGREVKREIIENEKTTVEMLQDFSVSNKISSRKLFHDKKLLRDEIYQYDVRGRLINYQCTGEKSSQTSNGKAIQRQQYDWDAFGNLKECITTSNNINETVEYKYNNINDPCQLTNIINSNTGQKTISLKYDAQGRLIEDEAGRRLTYDILGRIKTIYKDSQTVTNYSYDALNRLITKKTNDDLREFYYKSDILVNEIYTDSQIKYNKLGRNCLGFLQESKNNGNSDLFQYTETGVDDMGSVFAIFQNKGAPEIISYSPWGSIAESEIVGPRFNGEHWDASSSRYLLGNGYRGYSPELMRFTAPDSWSPFGAGGINAYTYCDGDPVNLSDPSGHISGWAWASIITGGIGLLLAPVTFGASLELGLGVAIALTVLEAASGATAIISGALEEKNPSLSESLGWASLGLGIPSMAMPFSSIGKSAPLVRGITLGRDIQNFNLIAEHDKSGALIFEDTYRNERRLNLIAHGTVNGNSSGLVIEGQYVSAENFVQNGLVGYDMNNYRYIRTLVCYSAEGGSNSFAGSLANITNKSVKGFVGVVQISHNPEMFTKNLRLLRSKNLPERLAYETAEASPFNFMSSKENARRFNYPVGYRHPIYVFGHKFRNPL